MGAGTKRHFLFMQSLTGGWRSPCRPAIKDSNELGFSPQVVSKGFTDVRQIPQRLKPSTPDGLWRRAEGPAPPDFNVTSVSRSKPPAGHDACTPGPSGGDIP